MKKDWRNEAQLWDIWCYDCKSNSNYYIIEEKQLKETVLFSRIAALFLNHNELWIEIENEECSFLYYPFLSLEKQSESKIKKDVDAGCILYASNCTYQDL